MRYHFNSDFQSQQGYYYDTDSSAEPYQEQWQQSYGAPKPAPQVNPPQQQSFPDTNGLSPAMDYPDYYEPADTYIPTDYTPVRQGQDIPYPQPNYQQTSIQYLDGAQEPWNVPYQHYSKLAQSMPAQPYQPFHGYPQQQMSNPVQEETGYPHEPQMTPFQQFDHPQQNYAWPMPTQMNSPQQAIKQGGVMGYFHDDNGQLDVDKMLSTVGHMANTFQQLSPVVKGIGSIFSAFRK